MQFRKHYLLSGSVAALMGTLYCAPAHADTPTADATTPPDGRQDATTTPDGGRLEDIVVTAQKRPENLQKAPVAITAISGERLVDLGIRDIRQAVVELQSVRFQLEGSNSELYIRGIGSFLDTASVTPLVTTIIDGMAVPREATGAPLFDVNQVEVMPGPQGTLYGRSGAGGIINITNKRPVLGESSASGILEIGNYTTIHPTLVGNIAMGDNFSLRLAVDYQHRNGYQKSGGDYDDTASGRISALWQANDRLSVYAWGQYQHLIGGVNLVQRPFLHGDPRNDLNAQGQPQYNPNTPNGLPQLNMPIYSGGAQVDYHLDGMTISYIPTAFVGFQNQTNANGTALVPGDPTSNLWSKRYAGIRSYSQELKFASNGDSDLKWLAGLYWYHQNYNYYFIFTGFRAFDDPDVNEDGYVAYGQLTYPILKDLRLTVGGRYNIMRKSALGYTPDLSTGGTTRGAPFTFDHTWHPFTWKVGLDGDVAKNVMAYAAVQTDWGAGTFNETQNTATFSNYVPPAKLLSFTGGFKSRFLDGRLQINNEAYYYIYKHLLVQSFNNLTGQGGLFTPDEVTIWGAELSIKYLATRNDQVNLGVGYLHARNTDFVIGTKNYNGLSLPQAPDVTFNVGYSHTWDLNNGANLRLLGNLKFMSAFWNTFDHQAETHEPSSTTSDVTLTYTPASSKWSFSLWVKNLENTAISDSAANGVAANGVPFEDAYFTPPRTFGVRFTFKN